LKKTLFFLLATSLLSAFPTGGPLGSGVAAADEPAPYLTLLAGEECTINCFGRSVAIPARDRDNALAVTLGGMIFTPSLAGHAVLPMGALYWKHRWDDIRVRGIFSGVVNEVDVSKTSGRLQLLGHLDNNTIPFSRAEIVNGQEVEGTSITWGTVSARAGVGVRLPVAPFQIDNDLRLQLYYQTTYLYSGRVADTSPAVMLPPDTVEHGPLFRVRYDGMRRNLMELPHRGMAAGLDAGYMRRNNWSDANYGGAVYREADTRDYLKLSGYVTVASGLPFLSEKNRLLTSLYGGVAPYGTLDRFSAFRIGGGPVPSESDDLARLVFPGAMFSQFPATDYLLGALEYRRELLPFLYLHLRGTYGRLTRTVFTDPQATSTTGYGEAFTVGLTSGFLWKSELHVEYTYDTRFLRNGTRGGNVILLWSKSF
jgi:hypothetical protein